MHKRISLALETGAAPLDSRARIVVFDPPAPPVLPGLSSAQIDVISPSSVMHTQCKQAGLSALIEASGTYGTALVCLGRSRAFNRVRLAQAAALVEPGGYVLVDGQKTDGVESVLKECKGRVEISDSFVKSHGRLFWFRPEGDFADWAAIADDWPPVEGFRTGPGVFSAEGVDPGSWLLAETLPKGLSGFGTDLGAGWGYLSRGILADNPDITKLFMVEEDHRALRAAQDNIDDPRAEALWADATAWRPPVSLDFVITNPPFHASRAADPSLGRAFLSTAAGALTRQGRLWLVANRHLPYEAHLQDLFHDVTELVARDGYKVILAGAPKTGGSSGKRS